MALFYTNENFPIKVVQYLREMGHDVLTSYEAGNANQRIPDEEVLMFAAKAGRILVPSIGGISLPCTKKCQITRGLLFARKTRICANRQGKSIRRFEKRMTLQGI